MFAVMRRVAPAIVIVIVAVCLCGVARSAQNDATEQQQVVSQYLRAYLQSDMPGIARLLPARFDAMFGPYPFVGDVSITQAKVQTNQALLEFTGTPRDLQLPHNGGVLLYRRHSTWYVRQVLFYDHIPRIFNLPTHSVTAADRNQELKVRIVGMTFFSAWARGELSRIADHWYDWPHSTREPIKGLSCSNLTFTRSYTPWHDSYLRYTAKVTYQFGVLSYSMQMKGGLLLTTDGQGWKVRGNVMVFDF